MNLRLRLILAFAATLAGGSAILFFATQSFLMSNFLRLESEQVGENIHIALDAFRDKLRDLSTTANDYAAWDLMYRYAGNNRAVDIGQEFQDGALVGLEIELVVVFDTHGNIMYSKAYDLRQRRPGRVPFEFLETLLRHPEVQMDAIAHQPREGLLRFPDGIYEASFRPILTSQRQGPARGLVLVARRLRLGTDMGLPSLAGHSLTFQSLDAAVVRPEFAAAKPFLNRNQDSVFVEPLNKNRVAGFALLKDMFGAPLLLTREEFPRPIYARGRLSELYLMATLLAGAAFSSIAITLFMQKFILSRITRLSVTISEIGRSKSLAQRVSITGSDEISALEHSVNTMLNDLERTQSHFHFLTNNIHQVFWVRNVQESRYEFISQGAERILPGARAQAIKRGIPALDGRIYEEDRLVLDRILANQNSGKQIEGYFRVYGEDGTLRWLWDRSYPVFDSNGKLSQTIGITEDITSFKRNEEALLLAQQELETRVEQRTAQLAERSAMFNLLLDSVPGAIYGIDLDGNCTFCSPGVLRLLGYDSLDEILGKNPHTLFHQMRPDGTPYPREECPIYSSFHETRDIHVDDEVFWRKDGSSFPVEYYGRRILRNGKVAGAVVTFTDISMRRRQEVELRLRLKLEAVGRLAAGIAHEINSPIQFIADNTRFLQRSFEEHLKLMEKLDELQAAAQQGAVERGLLQEVADSRRDTDWDYYREEIPRSLAQVMEGLQRVSVIVRSMREFSHVDRLQEKSPGDINRALETTLVVARNELKYVADVETHFGEIPLVSCNLGDMNQVFLNLLVNAAHAIGEANQGTGNKGKITVTTIQDGDFVDISIADTGTGIADEHRDNIFDPFFTTKGVGKGTGQGLSIARAIVVDRHGGSLTFTSQPGKGTTFHVRLPLDGSRIPQEILQ